MLFKSLFLSFSFGVFCSVFAQTSISELKTPNKSTIDFTFNSVDKTSPTFSNGTIVDKVSYELNSLQKLFPRLFKVSSCEKDSYNTLYCPDALVKADEYWGYDQSEVISKKQTVIDFEQGTYQELTSTVRDFMDGFANTHNSTVTDYQTGSGTANVGTVIDYQNGSSVSGIGQVVDYTNKASETLYANKISKLNGLTVSKYGTNSYGIQDTITYGESGGNSSNVPFFQYGKSIRIGRGSDGFTISLNSSLDGLTVSKYGTNSYGIQDTIIYDKGSANSSNVPFFQYGKSIRIGRGSDGFTISLNSSLDGLTVSKYGTNSYGIQDTIIYGESGGNSSNVPFFQYGKSIRIGRGSDGFTISLNSSLTCPLGYTDNGTNCKKATLDCPSGYTATTGAETSKGQCKRTVSYNFYQYTCPSTYTPINYGFTSFSKTDPNTTTENWNTLDDAVNSATPPTGNCQKTITYSYYKYNCPTGYTVRDGGLTSACPRTDPNKTINNESTLSQPCNNSTPPTGNCEKIIPYTFYSYECSSGYTAIDKGLATCTKTDSSTSTNTSSTLSQPCNSATPPKENCYKDISYKHYTYGCSPGYITDNYGLSTMEQYI